METKGIGIKNKGIFIFGIILLLIGLGASFYEKREYLPEWGYDVSRGYPYQVIGTILVLAGIVFIALGFFYSPRKTEPIKQST